jgi:diguanylate cyclase (GGDEF)-like protein
MRVVSCILVEHNLWFVALAAATCVVGCSVTVPLWRRALVTEDRGSLAWCFLSAVTAGGSIWATHFIAMLGYRPAAPVTFDAALTIASALIAVAGTGLGIVVAATGRRVASAIIGGGVIGTSVAAMHYVGMLGYRVQGLVTWSLGYILLSLLAAGGGSVLAVELTRRPVEESWRHAPTAVLVGTIVTMHFLGMSAFAVSPMPGTPVSGNGEAFAAIAVAVALVALVMIGTGLSSNLIAGRLRATSSRLDHIARHDALTGLANRRQLMDELALRCAALGAGGEPFALLTIDLDRFKLVNDTLGHHAGDQVLKEAAERLASVAEGGCLLARPGGDEFAIVAPVSLDRPDRPEALAACVVEAMSHPFVVSGQVAELGASVGVARTMDSGSSADQLSQNADLALYAVKTSGRNGFRLFTAEMAEATRQRLALTADVRRAAVRREFEVHYQPLVDARTGAFTGAEALARWSHPTQGWIPPAVFIPLVEELDLMGQMGLAVLRRACQDAAAWPAHLSVAVNLSPVQLLDAGLPQAVAEILVETGLDASRLDLEITETALIGSSEAALVTLKALAAQGVSISLDDFGTGYSSLSYLSRFPISRIKVDQSFVQGLPSDPRSSSIVRAIAQLGRTLGMKVTAEGVETAEQRDWTAAEGCDDLQGYLFGRPVPAAELATIWDGGCARAA